MTVPATGPVVVDRGEIAHIVQVLAEQLSAAHGAGVVLVGVLPGCAMFLADLVRAMTTEPVVDFLAVTPFGSGTGRARVLGDLSLDIAGRQVVLVTDVVETGLSATYLLGELARRGPSSLGLCALVDRSTRRLVPVDLAWRGIDVGGAHVVGYGLDHGPDHQGLDHLVIEGAPAAV